MSNFDITKTAQQPGKIWVGLSVPGAGAKLTIGADGTPDATENPNALHLGLTESGARLMVETTTREEFFDEFAEALDRTVEQRSMKITAELSQVMDFDILEEVLNGIGTRADAAGYESVTFGTVDLTYTGAAVIFPLKEDPTNFGVFHIYKGMVSSNVDMAISRQERSKIPLEIVGVGIPGRAAADTLGRFWKEV